MSEEQPKPRKVIGSYFRTPNTGEGIPRSREPIGSNFRTPEASPHTPQAQQAIPTTRDRQPEPQLKKEPEPDRYQPKAGYSRLGRDTLIDPSGSYIVTNEYVDVTQASRRQGTYIVGLQGYGKSGLIENMIIQDIKQNNIGICVLDPHGELIDHVLARIPDRDKEHKVILLDLKHKDSYIGLNLLDCSDPTDDDAIMDTLSQVLHVFEKAFGVSQEATPRIYDYLFYSAYTLIANPGHTLIDIPLVFNDNYRQVLLRNVSDAPTIKFGKII